MKSEFFSWSSDPILRIERAAEEDIPSSLVLDTLPVR